MGMCWGGMMGMFWEKRWSLKWRARGNKDDQKRSWRCKWRRRARVLVWRKRMPWIEQDGEFGEIAVKVGWIQPPLFTGINRIKIRWWWWYHAKKGIKSIFIPVSVMNLGHVIASRDTKFLFWTHKLNSSASTWTHDERKVASEKWVSQN